QAEDGIRDGHVTGVQTCALPIYERRYPVIDLTNQQSVGILGEEFMLTMAHVGLNFIVKGRVWQMKQITDDGKVYVLPINDPTAEIGRASCRERVYNGDRSVALIK